MSLTEQEAQKLDDTLNYAQRTALAAEQFIDELRNNGGNASLSDAVDSDRSDVGASSAAVKAAYDRAVAAGAVSYELCEFYYFRHPTLRPGFVQAAGGLIANAATLYPAAFAYLQTSEGSALCVTESEWQALSTAIYYTDVEGNQEGWNGVGGVPWFVIDTNAGTIRVPDIRGMYAEAAGLDSLAVGGVHEDRVRRVQQLPVVDPAGTVRTDIIVQAGAAVTHWGPFLLGTQRGPLPAFSGQTSSSGFKLCGLGFDNLNLVPAGSRTSPRAWGSLACVYLGS